MSNSAARLVLEAAIRERLGVMLGIELAPQRVETTWRRGGSGAICMGDFDAVSQDGTVLAQISTSAWMEPGQRRKIIADAARMAAVPGARSRILVFVTKMAADDARGIGLPEGTEIVEVGLSGAEMRLLLEATRASRAEMGAGADGPGGNARRRGRALAGIAWIEAAAASASALVVGEPAGVALVSAGAGIEGRSVDE